MTRNAALGYELATARAEESEALRRVRRLQVTGAAPGDLRDALAQAQACQSRSSALARELRKDLRQPPKPDRPQ